MKIVKKEDRVSHENSPRCIAFEYPMGDDDINTALVEVNGRYPDTGYVTNELVKEMMHVVQGSGRIVVGDEEHNLSEGDTLLLFPGEKYFLDGKMKLVIPCSPAWSPEQHKHTT
jgi:mannose-6-phosphate isomerase-like protein (cupin superfamily)